jgi:predicted MFS family arabinose efflux permease
VSAAAGRWQYLISVAAVLVVLSGMLALVAYLAPTLARHAQAAATGIALAAVLLGLSFTLVDWGRTKTQRAFMTTVVGTILGKMALVGLTVVAVLKLTTLPRGAFLAGFFGGWVLVSIPMLVMLGRSGVRGAGDEDESTKE